MCWEQEEMKLTGSQRENMTQNSAKYNQMSLKALFKKFGNQVVNY